MAALRGLRRMLCVLPLMALAACGGVGKGDKVDHVQMYSETGTTITLLGATDKVLSYQCLRQKLGLFAVFGKNGTADYTARPGTTWTSSNPDIVRVSDGTDLDPDYPDRYLPKGIITPLREGSAVITADYVGVSTSIQVVVREPDSIILSTSPFDTASDASAAGPLSIATKSTQQYYAYAKLRDENDVVIYKEVIGNAKWTSTDDPDAAHISVTTPSPGTTSGGGLVTGLSPGGPYTVQANFSACPGTKYEYITSQVQVSDVVSLSIKHDPNFLAISDPALPLAVNTAEAFVVKAKLVNGDEPDISYQATLSIDQGPNIMSFANNVGVATDQGTTNIVASFKSAGPLPIKSPPLTVQTINAFLTNYAISPGPLGDPPVAGAPNDRDQYIAFQGFHKYHAVGSFTTTETVPATTFKQDLTNSSTWVSLSPADVAIGNAGELVGVAVSQRSKQTCVIIKGLLISNPQQSLDTTSLGVGAPVSNSTCP